MNIRVLDIEMEHVGEVFDGSQKDVSDLLYRKGKIFVIYLIFPNYEVYIFCIYLKFT